MSDNTKAKATYIFVCLACGKTSTTTSGVNDSGKSTSSPGWDESCVRNCKEMPIDRLIWDTDRTKVIGANDVIVPTTLIEVDGGEPAPTKWIESKLMSDGTTTFEQLHEELAKERAEHAQALRVWEQSAAQIAQLIEERDIATAEADKLRLELEYSLSKVEALEFQFTKLRDEFEQFHEVVYRE